MKDIDELEGILCKYFDTSDTVGEHFIDNIWIRSNSFYVFFGEERAVGKTYAMLSKKYYLTIELEKDVEIKRSLDRISKVIDIFRSGRGVNINKYQFWLPHCLVNGTLVETKLIAESFGITRELSLDYLMHYNDIFSKIYDIKKNNYLGLPLLETYEEAEKYKLRDNTKDYLKGLKKLSKLLKQ